MANELEIENGITGRTTYALIRNSAGKFWNGTTFANYLTANRDDFAVTLTELGTASGIFQADFPSDITTGGSYRYIVYQYTDVGTEPTESDIYAGGGTVDWTGTAAVEPDTETASAGEDFWEYVKRTFRRDDKDTEGYEAITDAVQIMRRRFGFDEAETETETTDEITVLGDYKLDLESDFGLLIGLEVEDTDTGTPLVQLTKKKFDEEYASINIENDKGYPKHFCIFAGQIQIGPIPDRTSYTYRLAYSKRGGTVTASTTAVPFTDLYRDILKDCTLWKLNETLEKFDTATYFKGRFEEGFQEAVDREKKNKGAVTFVQRPFSL